MVDEPDKVTVTLDGTAAGALEEWLTWAVEGTQGDAHRLVEELPELLRPTLEALRAHLAGDNKCPEVRAGWRCQNRRGHAGDHRAQLEDVTMTWPQPEPEEVASGG